jgi:hypothetical protein
LTQDNNSHKLFPYFETESERKTDMRFTILYASLILIILIVLPSNPSTATNGTPLFKYPEARKDLIIPDEIWNKALTRVNYDSKPLGYTFDEMANYQGTRYVLPSIENMFRDVKTVPRFSGRFGDLILADPEDIALTSYLGFSLLDARGGREIEPPKEDDWGVDWIEKGATCDQALEVIIREDGKKDLYDGITHENHAEWTKLPDPVKRLAIRLILASIRAEEFIFEAFDEEFLVDIFDVENISEIKPSDLYVFASMPWQDTSEVIRKEAFNAPDKTDLAYLAYGSQIFVKLTQSAIKEYRDSKCEMPPDFKYCEFSTSIGRVGISGISNDTIKESFSLLIDIGGNDTYNGKKAVPISFDNPIGVLVDLAGNDTYDCQGESASLACGNHGIGFLADLSGDDQYISSDSGIGSALYGAGIVVDYDGNDKYEVKGAWGEGSAHVGVGILVDLNGDDSYYCMKQSQAFGSTLGVGILLDVKGNDSYLADPEGDISEPFHNNTVSFAQGTGFGRRADFGDGHSLGGGYGILVDGSGDDSYEGGVYCQGAGYWWSVGICEDRSGNDSYKNVWYSLGSAPHFAIGCCVDLEGNDKYNVGNETKLACQTQGCARDGSIAVFIDGSGNDEYYHTNRCAGSGDLNSIALFWDRCGNDIYRCNRDAFYSIDLSYGDAPFYEPFGNFHDDLASIGVFLDTGGEDFYTETVPKEIPDGFVNLKCKNNTDWYHRNDPRFRGYGIDEEWFVNEVESD